jgi:hypothetical protein
MYFYHNQRLIQMKYAQVIVLLLFVSTALVAQPEITRNDLLMIGDEYSVGAVDPVPDPGNSGAGVIWDFSGVEAVDPQSYDVVLPGTTPYGGTYPDANLALVAKGNGLYQYQNLTASTLEEFGYVVPGFSTLIYDNSRRYLELPFGFNSQWSDDYTYTIDYQTTPPITTFGEGGINVVVDGYGTLILPQGAFADALRLRVIGESTDTTDLGFNLYERNYYNDTSYVWMSPSYHAPLCTYISGSLLRVTTVAIGDTMVVEETDAFMSFTFDPLAEPMPLSTRDLAEGNMDLQISPNPIISNIELAFTSKHNEEMMFEVRDAHGRLMTSSTLRAERGENVVSFQLPELSAGLFLATIQGQEGVAVLKVIHAGR